MLNTSTLDREAIGELPNPLGLQGIEFIEYSTSRPQALGQVLERLGFVPVARHRSREVLLYRQGDVNIIVNAHQGGLSGQAAPTEAPAIAAVALRVRDAAAAYRRVLELGAWAVPTQVEVMELNIPAIHGAGSSRLYFVDRWREFSIYDVDFIPIPGVNPQPPAEGGLHLFGVVQYIGLDRTDDWTAFYGELLGFAELPREQSFGVLTSGSILASPCGTFYWQLIEPEPDAADFEHDELLQRVGFGVDDVTASVASLRARGVEFVESTHGVRTTERGALTRPQMGSLVFELVHDPR
ncbi:4-hydroxyphenylpyruvate dioxygenase [Leptothrix cholodnii SP-6]|uniref:4-hydroxyphenylpyruvate dioxygenase n=1 Tax=Leptothrix cholodnii (strain ATCC 51168 / LMG 8142 / SP-6) TaxID=395495 RepID=B1Y5P9_LEPCP|nr:VOC family protein [Leptothrix cholodnii]ACB35945.1 4-hydroxyphenylpyruvate dioxygenase [Leptothrix cholodnii SP-6]